MVTDIHLNQAVSLLKTLTEKLYHMNSRELLKAPGATIDSRIAQIFKCPPVPFSQDTGPDLNQGADIILAGFDPDYTGDRVYAIVLGLYTMIHTSYAGNCELFITDFLNSQALYNSARNIEILVWRLSHRRNLDGSLFLETNQCTESVWNLSFERLFGKLISLQDTMARMVASRNGRMITKTVHQAAGMVFLPIGL
ncbi:MAG: hypothetical protein K9K21_08020 [Desulfotignum sp.]|nr:hypothetical protein [Desulfotignum sp.]MCF8113779.1 hypothetical protein [Desulfotignum sp.]MCF8125547.1 hypothetical protein [Desulfotignum sp.]